MLRWSSAWGDPSASPQSKVNGSPSSSSAKASRTTTGSRKGTRVSVTDVRNEGEDWITSIRNDSVMSSVPYWRSLIVAEIRKNSELP